MLGLDVLVQRVLHVVGEVADGALVGVVEVVLGDVHECFLFTSVLERALAALPHAVRAAGSGGPVGRFVGRLLVSARLVQSLPTGTQAYSILDLEERPSHAFFK